MILRAMWIGLVAAAFSPPGLAADPPNLTGNWEVSLEIAGQTRAYLLEIKQQGEKIEAVLVSPRTQNRYPARNTAIKDNALTMEIIRPIAGNDVVMKVKATLDPAKKDVLEGTLDAEGVAGGKFVAHRKAGEASAPTKSSSPIAGKWKSVTVLPDGQERESEVAITEKDGKHTGKTTGRNNTIEFKSVTLDGKKVEVHLVIPIGGTDTEFVIRAELDGDTLKGKWSTLDDTLSGEWRAKKVVESPASAPAPARGSAPEAPPVKLASRYRASAVRPDGSKHDGELVFNGRGADLSGTMTMEGGKKTELRAVSLRGNQIEFAFPLEGDGGARRVRVTGTVTESGSIKGTWRSGDATGEWSASPVDDL